jgi:hypothetical protein
MSVVASLLNVELVVSLAIVLKSLAIVFRWLLRMAYD